MRTISEILKTEIKKSELNVAAIARAADVETASLYRFINGQRDLRLWTVDRVARVLGLTLVHTDKR